MAERKVFNWTQQQGKGPAAAPADDAPRAKPKRKAKPKD